MNLKTFKKKTGWTYAKIAKNSGVSVSKVVSLVKDPKEPTKPYIKARIKAMLFTHKEKGAW